MAESWSHIDTLIRELSEPEDPDRIAARAEYSYTAESSTYERILGDNNLDEFFLLSRGCVVGQSVARLHVRPPRGAFGTGFLVGPGLLLTNNHVLSRRSDARSMLATFDYEIEENGLFKAPTHFRATDEVFLTSRRLDYTFVSIEPVSSDGRELADFGMLPLLRRSGKALKREYVNIIQHPRGGYKKIALRENLVLGRADDFIYYATDTEPGSSGSPVMNLEWQVAALHHMAVPDRNDVNRFVANRGVRVSSIVEDVEQRAEDNDARRVALLLEEGRRHEEEALLKGRRRTSPGRIGRAAAVQEVDRHPLQERKQEASALERWTATDAQAAISPEAYDLIFGHEIGSPAYYKNILKEAPTWPRGMSGVTIGVGYDLGQHGLEEFRRDWGPHLPPSDLARLEAAVGVSGGAAERLTERLKDVRIPLEVAEKVFIATTLPKYTQMTFDALPAEGMYQLHPHSVGALVSLVFNRGASFGRSGDRFREMRAIREALGAGEFDRIPDLFRSMNRLWQDTGQGGLLRRRDEEADLFARGLALMPSASAPGGEPEEEETDDDEPQTIGDIAAAPSRPVRPSPVAAPGEAYWPKNHRNAPDTWHLPGEAADEPFVFDVSLVHRLIEAGHYRPHTADHGKLILALSGCSFVDGGAMVEDVRRVNLRPVRPDHVSFRCLLGIYDLARERISLYLGSTVPNARAMRSYARGGDPTNLLPTGCYEYCVGSHCSPRNGEWAYVLRLGDGPEPEHASALMQTDDSQRR